jgi:hypothetical protein
MVPDMFSVRYYMNVYICIGSIVLSTLPLYSFWESITVWRSQSGVLVYGVADCHGIQGYRDYISRLNYSSRFNIQATLERFAVANKQQDFFAMVEDMYGYTGNNEAVKKFLAIYEYELLTKGASDSPLAGLARELKGKSFPLLNVEYA